MLKVNIQRLVQQALDKCGPDKVVKVLNDIIQEPEDTLTIVANLAGHPLRDEHCRGEVFIASEGFLDFTDESAATESIKGVLYSVAKKLRSKKYTKIYLVPFGPSVLSMNIKMVVYRVLHIETIDVLHGGNNVYYDIDVKHRHVVNAGAGEIG